MPEAMDGFEVGWRNAAGEYRLPLAEAASVEFEAGLPVRGFPSYRGQRHFPGLCWSATTGGHAFADTPSRTQGSERTQITDCAW